ncbi:MAG: ribosome assembly RNA-binding protein YhbY [Erysipelotrichaceae bacterium]
MLTGKQKRYLRSLANQTRALFQVGKDGLSDNLFSTIHDSLEAHELVKISVLKSCNEEVRELAFDLAAQTNSEIAQIIGRTIVLYRKSKNNLIQLP